jgi:limonene-1,2-epoxide hydrolase
MASISVDGGAAQTVDLYSATLKPATVVWKATGLGTATGHTVKVTVLSTRNPASTGNKVDIDAYLALK